MISPIGYPTAIQIFTCPKWKISKSQDSIHPHFLSKYHYQTFSCSDLNPRIIFNYLLCIAFSSHFLRKSFWLHSSKPYPESWICSVFFFLHLYNHMLKQDTSIFLLYSWNSLLFIILTFMLNHCHNFHLISKQNFCSMNQFISNLSFRHLEQNSNIPFLQGPTSTVPWPLLWPHFLPVL